MSDMTICENGKHEEGRCQHAGGNVWCGDDYRKTHAPLPQCKHEHGEDIHGNCYECGTSLLASLPQEPEWEKLWDDGRLLEAMHCEGCEEQIKDFIRTLLASEREKLETLAHCELVAETYKEYERGKKEGAAQAEERYDWLEHRAKQEKEKWEKERREENNALVREWTKKVDEAIASEREKVLKELEGMKKVPKDGCRCGGRLIPAHGMGKIVFEWQCSECDTYQQGLGTDEVGYNRAIADAQALLHSKQEL